MNQEDINELLLTRPARFMIYESYIVGGVGTYVLGDTLSGILKKDSRVILEPGGLESVIGFIDKNRKLADEAKAGERAAINLPMIKCSKIERGMMISALDDHPAERAKNLDYALGFFFSCNFKGEVESGMKFYLVNNRIARLCRIEVQCLIDLESEMIGKKEGDRFGKGEIVFLKIFSEEILVLEDPVTFPEFTLVKLRDNCQEVALGKIYRVKYLEEVMTEGNEEGEEEVSREIEGSEKMKF